MLGERLHVGHEPRHGHAYVASWIQGARRRPERGAQGRGRLRADRRLADPQHPRRRHPGRRTAGRVRLRRRTKGNHPMHARNRRTGAPITETLQRLYARARLDRERLRPAERTAGSRTRTKAERSSFTTPPSTSQPTGKGRTSTRTATTSSRATSSWHEPGTGATNAPQGPNAASAAPSASANALNDPEAAARGVAERFIASMVAEVDDYHEALAAARRDRTDRRRGRRREGGLRGARSVRAQRQQRHRRDRRPPAGSSTWPPPATRWRRSSTTSTRRSSASKAPTQSRSAACATANASRVDEISAREYARVIRLKPDKAAAAHADVYANAILDTWGATGPLRPPRKNRMPMTRQTFHVTGLDPRSALCGRNGHIWGAPHWPDDREMRAGLFTRCKDCDRLATPALRAAIDNAPQPRARRAGGLQDRLARRLRTARRPGRAHPNDSRQPGAGVPRARPARRRRGRQARPRGPSHQPGSAIRKTGRHNRDDPMTTAKSRNKNHKPLNEQTVRAIRRAYRPGLRLSKLQEQFGQTGMTIIAVANRSTYTEYETQPQRVRTAAAHTGH